MVSNTTFTTPRSLQIAVLFLVFNRMDTTMRVFDAIRQAKPPRLYIAADGPRTTKEGEEEKVNAVRKKVLEAIDWKCEVKTLFREQNLGCKRAISEAISWFFEHEEMGIILEDDCLPSQTFFWFTEEALLKYNNHQNIYGITGVYLAPVRPEFSNQASLISFPMIWGWASWRRVWEQYDAEMKSWTGDINYVAGLSKKPRATKKYFKHAFDETASGNIDTWDYQFAFQVLKNEGSFIAPNVNLISNIGFGEGATNTAVDYDSFSSAVPINEASINLDGFVDNKFDRWLCLHIFAHRPIYVRAINKLARVLLGKNIIK